MEAVNYLLAVAVGLWKNAVSAVGTSLMINCTPCSSEHVLKYTYLSNYNTEKEITMVYSEPWFKISLGSSGFATLTEENLKWRKFNTEVTETEY
jgi:hypothetical protein